MFDSYFRNTLILVIASFMSACGGEKSGSNGSGDDTNNKAGSDTNYSLISGEIENENGNLIGSGKLVFKNSLGSTDANKGFDISFTLEEEGAAVTLHAFADKQLNSGINIQFTRNSDKIKCTINGTATPVEISADGSASVAIDVHNKEPETHVIIQPSGKEVFSTTGSGAWTKGGDKFWGLTLKNAKVNHAKDGAEKHPH